MTAKPDPSEQRDRALARLLAGALQTGASAEAAGQAACPDAEVVAAYASQGLAGDEREHLEGHFAACERCQKILALLAVSLEAPLSESLTEPPTEMEVSRFGDRAAVASAPALPAAARPQERPSPRWFWWLAPALGTAAAAMLWMVLRPASPGGTAPVQTAADYSRPAEQETRSLSAPAGAPSPPAQTPPAAALRRETQGPNRTFTARAEPATQAKQEAARDEVPALSLAPPAETAPATPAARSAVAMAESAPPVTGTAQSVIVAEQMPLVTTTNSAPGAAASASPAPVPGPPSMNEAVRATELPVAGRNFAQLNVYTFASPDSSAVWRLGAGGSIQRSTDRGQTWQQQASGVTTDLVSGSAASKEVAWVVGRAGVILRTTDGVSWQRVASPDGATGDWAAVVAHDALGATVVAADLRRFSTQDGGRTWALQ